MYPQELREAEQTLVDRRRAVAGVDANAPTIGVACSGGGIRSATVCLGMFQAFAKSGLLPRIDYISTISGGGYFGSFLGSLFLPRHPVAPESVGQIPGVVANTLGDDQSSPVKWLRKHGRYIAPNGPADYANIVAIYIRNWIGVQYVIGITFLTLFFFFLLLRALEWQYCDLSQIIPFLPPNVHTLVSPFLIIALLVFLIVSVPLGWSFWLTQYGTNRDGVEMEGDLTGWRLIQIPFLNNWALWASLFVLAICVAAWVAGNDAREKVTTALVLLLGILALLCWGISELLVTLKHRASAVGQGLSLKRRHSLVRNLLSDWLGTSLKVFAAVAAIGIIDSLTPTIYEWVRGFSWPVGGTLTVSSVFSALLALVHQLAPNLQRAKGTQSRLSLWTLAAIAGLVAIGLIVLLWDLVAYAIAFHGQPIDWGDANVVALLSGCLAIGLVLTLLTAQTLSFLNLSSLQAFYSARLRRAYLGASNPRRTGYDCTGTATIPQSGTKPTLDLSIRREVEGDDSTWTAYAPHAFGGPLHLIGVTVNHTIGRGSDIDLHDRKGFTMTVGPAGFSASIDSHALLLAQGSLRPLACPRGEDPVFGKLDTVVQPEPCPLSRWMAISGAAFSTGLGARTRTGISVLLGTANVRLGYWWASGALSEEMASILRSLFRTQAYLYGELLGTFAGSEYRHWYLSDGGHSENTGVYELIRRQVPFIVLLDNGADPDYEFDDFGNLVRRVRIDFGADIVPLSKAEFDRPGIGSVACALGLGGLRRRRAGDMGVVLADSAIAAFKVTYPGGGPWSLLLLAKPTLVGDEPEDVVNYAKTHAAFPQEPTSDQFFDEAQWESYRKLGQHIGTKLAGML